MRLIAVTGAVVVALSGCGVATDDSATVVDSESVPFELLEESPAAGVPASPGSTRGEICLVDDATDQLVPVEHELQGTSLEAVVAALGDGPTGEESSEGLRSALPGPDVVASVELQGGVATVDLDDTFRSITGSDQVLAIAQVVCTLTARPGVGRVSFTLEGATVEIPRGNGSLTSGSVSRDDYRTLFGM